MIWKKNNENWEPIDEKQRKKTLQKIFSGSEIYIRTRIAPERIERGMIDVDRREFEALSEESVVGLIGYKNYQKAHKILEGKIKRQMVSICILLGLTMLPSSIGQIKSFKYKKQLENEQKQQTELKVKIAKGEVNSQDIFVKEQERKLKNSIDKTQQKLSSCKTTSLISFSLMSGLFICAAALTFSAYDYDDKHRKLAWKCYQLNKNNRQRS